ncbi:MAG: glycosyltransferase family 2 protein [Hydrococcus sp. C42_A2020_068]|uniref:hormogonium polysaccharide biosynthesis glycosyltransferase HpsN n=1 Tax=Pleurocapsa sp. PCC 7327 TaxID=118163 RepID=UPI00029F8CC9|nr:hormogonium polysaccharide biosynthesis glycosyltransferase HpsN [Pleurocapsa sp. PCC 7327]AFY75518.1 putative glycosyltransferase [Pleurocapsa sp. PCC 7327]MBF2022012.1 glycosyltransferase family 2 protein [Hydrococcus sp. C42_A2020_068]
MVFPSISIIIPTYRREEPLQETLEDVLKQDYSAFEVLVIDQTPTHTPTVEAYLEQLAESGKIRWFRVNWASLPGARNYGVRRATGEIILFIDDDVKLPEGYLQAHARNYQERPEIGAVAGRVFDRMKLADSQKINPKDSPYSIDYLPPQAMDPGIAWYYIDLVHTVKPQRVISTRGCNMSFRRDIFTERGIWFDERFRGSAVREESDFCLRLRQTGYHIWYDPEAYLVHLGEETGGCHDINTRSLQYQLTFYHNHFLMALKNLTPVQQLRLYAKLFDCHVLGNPPCNKGGSPIKILTRGIFYSLGFLDALSTLVKSLWENGQIYSRQDLEGSAVPVTQQAKV